MKTRTSFLTATALCLGFVVSTGMAGGYMVQHTPKFGIQLTTSSNPVTLVCTHGVSVSAVRGRPGFVSFPLGVNKLLCNLWAKKGMTPVKVTDFGLRIHHGENRRVKVFSRGIPRHSPTIVRYQRTMITWGDGVRIQFLVFTGYGYGMK